MDEQRRSVRIEVGTADSNHGGPGLPSPPESPRDQKSGPVNRLAIAGVAAAAVIGLVVVMSMLRPDSGETAAGTLRQAATTTITPSTTSATSVAPSAESRFNGDEAATARDSATNPDGAGGLAVASVTFEAISQETYITEIVPATVGYLALAASESLGLSRNGPPLWRSIDGASWTAVATTIEPDRPRGAGSDEAYVGLRSTDDGLEVLRVVHDPVLGPRNQVLELLTSAEGSVWSVAQTYDNIDLEAFYPRPLGGGHVVLIDYGSGFESVSDFLDEHTVVDIAATICHAERQPDHLAVYSCFGDSMRIVADDLIDPASAEQLFACTEAMFYAQYAQPGAAFSLFDTATGQVRHHGDRRRSLTFPVVTSAGVTLWIAGANGGGEPMDCAGFDVPGSTPEPGAILVWEPDEAAPVEIPLPSALKPQPEWDFSNDRPAPHHDGMVLADSSHLWFVDQRGQVRELDDLPATFGRLDYIDPLGEFAISVTPRTVHRWTLAAGFVVGYEAYRFTSMQTDVIEIAHADHDYVWLRTERLGLKRVTLPTATDTS